MLRFFFLLLLIVKIYLISDTIAVTENDPNSLVEGVSVITGDFYLQEEDVVIAGAEPIRLRRSYVSQQGDGLFEFHPHHKAVAPGGTNWIGIREPNGTLLRYHWKWKDHEHVFTLKNGSKDSRGRTNTARGKISSKSNLKNQKIQMGYDEKYLTVFCPDGTKRIYHINSKGGPKGFSPIGVCGSKYLLIEEQLPNGHKILYDWPKKSSDVWQIRSCNHSGSVTYAWARFYPKKKGKDQSYGDYGVETSDGRHLEYKYFSCQGEYQLKEVTSDERPTEKLDYLTVGNKRLLNTIVRPSNRSLRLTYYTKKKDPAFLRVKEIIARAKDSGEEIVTHRFTYDIKNRKTTVTDAYGVPTVYSFNESLRLTQIERFKGPQELYNQVKFIWGEEGSVDDSNLLCKILFDEKKVPIQATRYFYDSLGNVKKEQLYGNLTGGGGSLTLDSKGFPQESAEHYTVHSTHSKDGRDLLLSRKEDNGCSIEYSYLPKSPLIKEETSYDNGVAKRRKRYSYDKNNLLIQEVSEDIEKNTSHITNFHLNGKGDKNYLGLPKQIEEYAQNADGLVLLKKVLLTYGNGGRIEKKEVFDSNNVHRYTLYYRYEKGCLVEEINALGQNAISQYDELYNKTYYRGFGDRAEVVINYDLANRPVQITEKGEGLTRNQKYRYDYRNHKSESIDEYSNKTTYEQDPFGNTLVTRLPNGGVLSSAYDATGSVISHVDANGNRTVSSYSAYGKPLCIEHPDGSLETFVYNLDGTLKTHIDQNGMPTEYTYDSFKRVLSKKTPLSEETFSYDAYNLISQTDPEGCLTTLTYDPAGRKVAEKVGEEVTIWEYDSLGRPYKKITDDLVAVTLYDLLDRPIEERKEDLSGNWLQKISYGYDAAGNQAYAITYINGKEAKETLTYDAFRRAIKKTDALGFESHVYYDQKNHQKIAVDALGLRTVETYNFDNKIISSEKQLKNGEVVLSDEIHYDLNNNKIKKISFFEKASQETTWEYDSMNRLVVFTEGVSTCDEKITSYRYTPTGLLEKTLKPSGVSLDVIYNCLGYPIAESSSDGSINYSYAYDKAGYLIETKDENTGERIIRKLDPRGRVLQETLPSGLVTQNSYDLQGRREKLTLPDNSIIAYEFGPLHLKSVSKLANGLELYTHKYKAHDLSGHVLEESLPLNLGQVSRDYDLLGRSVRVDSPYFLQKDQVFDPVGNLLQTKRMGEDLSFTYDAFYQLSSEKEHEYLFDGYSNRISKDSRRVTYNALNQRSDLTYNLDGNPKSLKGKKLTYDALDRLISVDEESVKTVYTYDSFHRRLSKKVYVNSCLILERYYIYDGQNEIGAVDGSKKIVELRILGSTYAAEIGSAVALELNGELYIPFHDLHGSVAAIYSPSTGIYERYAYTAFGEERFSAPVSKNPWRFSSKRTDEETGLVYYGRRYYSPEMGRWLTQDPLGLDAGPNMYAFLSNGPLTRLDLYGLDEFEYRLFPEESIVYHIQNVASCAYNLTNSFKNEVGKINNSSCFYSTEGSQMPGVYLGFVNGIDTTRDEAQSHASWFSQGIETHSVYNATHSILADFLECCIGHRGVATTPVQLIIEACEKFNRDNILFPDRKMFWCVHSQGALHMYNALVRMDSIVQKRCIVLAIAPARVVPKRFCFDSFNYASERDVVPYLGLPIALNGMDWKVLEDIKELIILKPHSDASMLDHSFRSPTFEKTIQETLEDYIRDYGEK